MRSFDSKTHSFIVKMWVEETANDAGFAKWRGHITHVPDGARRYLEGVEEIPEFIKRYLNGPPEKRHVFKRLGRWWNPLRTTSSGEGK